MKLKRMVTDAMLAAMCFALALLALNFGNMKLTLESLPVLVGALLFGPFDGLVIGFIGTLLYQVLIYGVTSTTLLWILPYMACGLIAGWYAKHRGFNMTRAQTILIVVIAELAITTLNTGALYIDSHIYGYYYPALIVGMLIPRYAICVGKAVISGALLPTLIDALKRAKLTN